MTTLRLRLRVKRGLPFNFTAIVAASIFSGPGFAKAQSPSFPTCIQANWVAFHVDTLHPGDQYKGPTANVANLCMCSTVTYSMVSACAVCQDGVVSSWLSWIDSCPPGTVNNQRYPIPLPSGISVPAWAYMDVAVMNSLHLREVLWTHDLHQGHGEFDVVAAEAQSREGGPDFFADPVQGLARRKGFTLTLGNKHFSGKASVALLLGIIAGACSVVAGIVSVIFLQEVTSLLILTFDKEYWYQYPNKPTPLAPTTWYFRGNGSKFIALEPSTPLRCMRHDEPELDSSTRTVQHPSCVALQHSAVKRWLLRKDGPGPRHRGSGE
ncbi:hypothetical protein BU17DRAFT_63580 [Hysterangium stoloniferum]|nr:hypothetical protein BU17DRAFT_63580 [Hysterangium stoloniferum]